MRWTQPVWEGNAARMGQSFVIQLDNRPGELAHVARALASRGINIHHIAGSAASEKLCEMVTTDDDQAAREVLRSMGIPFVEGDALHVEMPDVPGALADFSERLAAAGVSVTGILVTGRRGAVSEVAVTVDDERKAREILGLPAIHVLADAH